MLPVGADLISQRGELVHAIGRRGDVRIEKLHQPREYVAVGTMAAIETLELEHLLEREAEHLELLDELEAPQVVVGVDAAAALDALDGLEKADFFLVADGPLRQPKTGGQLPDPIAFLRHCHGRIRQFTSTASADGLVAPDQRQVVRSTPCQGDR